VVLKRILPHLSSNPKFVKMFLAEARVSALLHHPAIVQVNDLGEVNGEYFLAMEYVDGLDLVSVLRTASETERPMPPGVACHVALALADALAYAHALAGPDGRPLEIVHRDVSPSNVMVTAQGAVKLLDFGIARVAGQARDEQTRTGTLKGKISYMSPEQADGRKNIDRRSDVFALGIVLWECLTAQRLFRGEDDMETLRLIRECQVWPPSSVRPEIDPALDAVVMKMLGRTPESRYQTCDEVAAALQPLVHRLEGSPAALKQYLQSLGATRQQLGEAGTTPAKRSASSGSGGTLTGSQGEVVSASRPQPRARWTLPLAGGALLVAAVGLTYVIARRPAVTPPPVPPPAVAVQPPPSQPPPPVHVPDMATAAPATTPPPSKPAQPPKRKREPKRQPSEPELRDPFAP